MKLQHRESDTTESSCDCFTFRWRMAEATAEGNPLLWASHNGYHSTPPGTHTHRQRGGTSQCIFIPIPVIPETGMGIWGICKPTAEEEEMLQESHVSVVMQVTHWSSSLSIHRRILSTGASIGGKNSNQLMQVLKWVIVFVTPRLQRRRWYSPSPAHAQCHEPGSVPSSVGQR